MGRAASARRWARATSSAGTDPAMPVSSVLFRQRRRVVVHGAQIGDHVGAILRLGKTGERHLGAAHESLRLEDHVVDVFVGPLAALGLQGRRIAEAYVARLLAADDVPLVRADLVWPALVDGMAGEALLHEDRLAGF